MPVRPEIALGVQRPKIYGPQELMTLRDLAQQGEMRRMQMEDAEEQRASRNALKQVYGNAANIDTATGMLRPEAIPQIGAISPQAAASESQNLLARNKLLAETRKAESATNLNQIQIGHRKEEILNEFVRGPALAAYDEAARTMPPEQAARRAQIAYSEGMERAGRSGLFSVEERGQFPLDFNPERVRQRLMQSKDWMAARKSGAPQRSERISGETLIQEERDPVTGAVREVGRGPRFSKSETDKTPKPPQGYRFTPDGNLEAIPGGPADVKAGAAEEKAAKTAEMAATKAAVVTTTVDQALKQLENFKWLGQDVPGSGLRRKAGAMVPGTDAYDLEQTINTVKANLGFKELADMRAASPTGGALGPVAVKELEFLQAAVAALDVGQSQEQLRTNLQKVKTHFEKWQKATEQAVKPSRRSTDRAPSPGTVMDGYRFKGGDPSNRNNWEKVRG